MENTEIIMNEEVMDVMDDCVTTSSGNGMKIFGGLLLAGGAAFGLYKLISKKIKSKKEQEVIVEPADEWNSDRDEDDEN